MQYVHYSVMQNEVLDYLKPQKEDAILVDCTLGEGGHSSLFLEKYDRLHVIGLDRDSAILEKAKFRLSKYGNRFTCYNTWFDDFWYDRGNEKADLILFDLGISVFHYEESQRGFSFLRDERLDMRLDMNQFLSAKEVVNEYPEEDLADVIYKYGEERYSRRIANAIVRSRKLKTIETTGELEKIVFQSVPAEYRRCRTNPATKTFQAIRIEVNGEIKRIERALTGALNALNEGGRMAVITFHSLEDRPVKWFFRERTDVVDILTKKPVVPTDDEVKINPPSRSAKLRVVEKRRLEI